MKWGPATKIATEWIVAISALGALLISAHNSSKISEVHVMINSRMSELLDLTKSASKAEGIKQGKEEQIPH